MRRALILGLLLAPGAAWAHPEHEVLQGAYLTLAPGAVRLQLDLVAGPEAAPAVLRALDADGDRRVTAAEARAYAVRVLALSRLSVDGAAAGWRLERVEAPAYGAIARDGQPIRIHATAARAERAGAHTLAYETRYRPTESRYAANVFLAAGGGWRHTVTRQRRTRDGRGLTVAFTTAGPR